MNTHSPHNLPWLDRLTMSIPGYDGYAKQEKRQAAAFALRDALVRRLGVLKGHIQQAIHDCLHREALSEIHALERIDLHLDRILERLAHVGTRLASFYSAPDLASHATLDAVYRADLGLFELAETLSKRFEQPDVHHDRLAEIEADLSDLEVKLDERAILIQKLG